MISFQFNSSDDPLDPTVEINESSSDDETIASIRRKSKEIFDSSRVDLSKPYYQVENGKIILKRKSLDHLKTEEKIIKECQIKPTSELEDSKCLTKYIRELKRSNSKNRKTKKKPDVLDKLIAQIDAQLIAKGLPVPESSPIENGQITQSNNFTLKKYNSDNLKMSEVESISNHDKIATISLTNSKSNNNIIVQQKKTDSYGHLTKKILNDDKIEIDRSCENLINARKINKSSQIISNEILSNYQSNYNNNSNDNFHWSEESSCHNESSRDTILDLFVSNGDKMERKQNSKFEIMESNDGSFVQYKVYDKFEDFSCEQKMDDHIVTSALQIERCKQIQNKKAIKRLNNQFQHSQKLFETYEAFLMSYERFLKLNHQNKIVFYEYDGIRLNIPSKIIADNKTSKISPEVIKRECVTNTDIYSGTDGVMLMDNTKMEKISLNKNLDCGFDFEFKYEGINDHCGKINSCYEILDPHGCELCGKTFKNKKALKEHNKNYHGVIDSKRKIKRSILWKCERCLKTFKHLKNLTRHQKKIHNKNTSGYTEPHNSVDLCLYNKTEINSTPKIKKKLKCVKCFETFASYKSMKLHVRYRHPKTGKSHPFKCKLCKIGFKRLTGLLGHVHFDHKVRILTQNAFISSNSNIEILNMKDNQPKSLQIVESKLLIADSTSILTKDCSIALSNKAASNILESNEEIVSKGRMERDPLRYQMNKITVAIKNGGSLDLYKCDKCPKVFATQKSLADHKRRVHLKSNLNNPNYPFICKLCKKGYRRSNDLMRHARLYHKIIIRNNRCIQSNKLINSKAINCTSFPKDLFEKTEINDHSNYSKSNINSYGNVAKKQLCVKKNAWICDFCSKSYDTQKKWRDHRRRVHISHPIKLIKVTNRKTIPEQISSKRNALQDSFNEQLLEKNCEGKILCQHCRDPIDSPLLYHFHINDKHSELIVNANSEYPYSCQKCRKVFTKSSEVIKHAKDVHGFILKEPDSDIKKREYFCDSCPKQFKFKQSLRRHIQSAHSMALDPK